MGRAVAICGHEEIDLRILSYIVKKCGNVKSSSWTPSEGEIRHAARDVAWEYAAMLAADLEIYAVDFCFEVRWQPDSFKNDTPLMIAINKTLAHMSYSRDRAAMGHVHFEGGEHVHGTVKLMRQTWAGFTKSMKPEYAEDIHHWLDEQTKDWRVKFRALEGEFEARVNELVHRTKEDERLGKPVTVKWMFNKTAETT
jgi:hypothetical protein